MRFNSCSLCRLALLRHRWTPGLVPLPQWHTVLASSVRLRLVVQCTLRSIAATVCNQCATVSASQGESDATTSHHHQAAGRGYIHLIQWANERAYPSNLSLSINRLCVVCQATISWYVYFSARAVQLSAKLSKVTFSKSIKSVFFVLSKFGCIFLQ